MKLQTSSVTWYCHFDTSIGTMCTMHQASVATKIGPSQSPASPVLMIASPVLYVPSFPVVPGPESFQLSWPPYKCLQTRWPINLCLQTRWPPNQCLQTRWPLHLCIQSRWLPVSGRPSPSIPEVVPLSSVVSVTAMAFLCVWATHCSSA